MRFLIQRVSKAEVVVNKKVVGKIDKGYMVLIGIKEGDTKKEADKLIKKMLKLRIFEDENGKMNLDIMQVGGKILAISQFTLYADTKKGNRPSFINSAKPEEAEEIYEYILSELEKEIEVQKGIFGAHMDVDFVNDGPVTIMLEEEN